MLPQPIARTAPVRPPGRPPKPAKPLPSGPSPAVARAIRFMVFGPPEGENANTPVPRPAAAKLAGISDETLRIAFRNPSVVRHYNEQLDVLRTSERARSVGKIAGLRDNAVSERVQLEAAKHFDPGERRDGVTVNVGVNVQTPGYSIAIPQEHVDAAPQLLKQARSTRNVLIDHAPVQQTGEER